MLKNEEFIKAKQGSHELRINVGSLYRSAEFRNLLLSIDKEGIIHTEEVL